MAILDCTHLECDFRIFPPPGRNLNSSKTSQLDHPSPHRNKEIQLAVIVFVVVVVVAGLDLQSISTRTFFAVHVCSAKTTCQKYSSFGAKVHCLFLALSGCYDLGRDLFLLSLTLDWLSRCRFCWSLQYVILVGDNDSPLLSLSLSSLELDSGRASFLSSVIQTESVT